MGKRLKDTKERVVQRSIGFRFRQVDFFNNYPEFKPDEFCRQIVDEQIEIIDPSFLEKSEEELEAEIQNNNNSIEYE